MGLQEKLDQHEQEEKLAFEAKLKSNKERLFELKDKRAFLENRNFVWFFKEYVENPYKAGTTPVRTRIKTLFLKVRSKLLGL